MKCILREFYDVISSFYSFVDLRVCMCK